MCTVSIIVPIYNSEQFLFQCISSILNQSFSDFELILVDDGSKDNSSRICDEFADKDPRIFVLHKSNEGVSAARNSGLDSAQGDWVLFIDSDDELLPGGLQVLVDLISDDADMVLAGYEQYDENGVLLYAIKDRIETRFSRKESLATLYEFHGCYYGYLGYIWNRMFRNFIIKQKELRFDTEITIKEDTLFAAQYICNSNGITVFSTTPVYHYNRRKGSAMGKASRNGFNYNYVSSFVALIKMKH